MITWNAYELAGNMVCAVGEMRDEVDILNRALKMACPDPVKREEVLTAARVQFELVNYSSPDL